ncbi:MAG: ABC transporter substrate-binding protein [Treponema sp.]|nr:ABC transporter substrate-binding protein [Treponema sp.]
MKSLKNKITVFLLLLLGSALLFPFSKRKGDEESSAVQFLKVASLNGPSSIPVAYLYENAAILDGAPVEFQLYASPVTELPKLLAGEVDIGFLPPNIAAKAYNSSNHALVMMGISGNGNLYLLSDDASLSSLGGLAVKRVYVAGQGATPEYVFRYLAEGLNVQMDFSIQTAELAAALASGKIHYALVPEPFATVATSKSASVRRSLDIQKLYGEKQGGGSYPMTVMVCRADFARKYPDTVQKFLNSYKKATEWTVSHPQEAGTLVEKHTLGLKADVAAASIPNANYVWIPAKKGRGDMEKLLSVFLSFAPESIGGALPDDGFYF